MQFTIFILLAILFVGQALLFFLFFRFFKHLNAKFNGVSGKNILKLLSDAMEKSESVENNLKQLLKETELDRKLLSKLVNFYTTVQLFRTPQLQTYFALIFSRHNAKNKIKKLPHKYLVPKQVEDINYQDVICIHYIRPVRDEYLTGAEIVLKIL